MQNGLFVTSVVVLLFYSLSTLLTTEAVTPSPGCLNPPSDNNSGLGSTLKPGEYEDFKRKMPGTQRRTHRLHLPLNYGLQGVVSPVLFHFHGWGDDYTSCGDVCSIEAVDKGFVAISMTGYGPEGWNSWKHGGSSNGTSPNSMASTACQPQTQGYCNEYKNSGCDGQCNQEGSHCWWTTCYDSVDKFLAILDEVEQSLCVDLDQIWAVGCSNGGMFTFELARDVRSASRLKGIVPIVGLPHYGYSEGPVYSAIRMMGMWGRYDDVVPPLSNTDDDDKTTDGGWYYTSSNKVMSDWTMKKGCAGNGQDTIGQEQGQEDWGISNYGDSLSCTQGCTENEASGDRIVGCIFEGKHWCSADFMWEPIFNFMLHDGSSDDDEVDCVNNKNFRYKDKGIKTCKWIGKRKGRRQRLCNSQVVVENCPGVCEVCCANDATFQFELDNGKEKECKWLRFKKRIKNYCPRGQIETQCPVNCGLCQNSKN